MLCLGEVLCSTELHQFLGCLLVAEILKCQTAASAKGSMFDDCKEVGGISAPSALRGRRRAPQALRGRLFASLQPSSSYLRSEL